MEKTKFKVNDKEAKELQSIILEYIVSKSKNRTTILDAYIIESVKDVKQKVDKAILKLNYSDYTTTMLTISYLDFITISILANYAKEQELKNNTGILDQIILKLPVPVINIMDNTKQLAQN